MMARPEPAVPPATRSLLRPHLVLKPQPEKLVVACAQKVLAFFGGMMRGIHRLSSLRAGVRALVRSTYTMAIAGTIQERIAVLFNGPLLLLLKLSALLQVILGTRIRRLLCASATILWSRARGRLIRPGGLPRLSMLAFAHFFVSTVWGSRFAPANAIRQGPNCTRCWNHAAWSRQQSRNGQYGWEHPPFSRWLKHGCGSGHFLHIAARALSTRSSTCSLLMPRTIEVSTSAGLADTILNDVWNFGGVIGAGPDRRCLCRLASGNRVSQPTNERSGAVLRHLDRAEPANGEQFP